MKVVSLFDGISGAQQALKDIGIEFDGIDNVYYASEIDVHAMKITQTQFPNTKFIGDVTKISNELLSEMVCPTLMIGGSPCQDLSVAGKMKGLEGARSGLFFEYVKLIKILKPQYIVLENVASMRKEHAEQMSKEFFGIPYIMIDSRLLTAQTRKRLYWVGKWDTLQNTYVPVNVPQPIHTGQYLKHAWKGGVNCTSRVKLKKEGTLAYQKTHANSRSLEQKSRCLTAGGQSITNSGATNVVIDGEYYIPSPETCELLQGFPINYTMGVSLTQRYKALGNSFTVPVISHILNNLLDICVE